MSMDTLKSEAEERQAIIDAADDRLVKALENRERAEIEVREAQRALEEARISGRGILAAWRVARDSVSDRE